MRRLFSSALLLLFCWPLISPALTLLGGSEASLSACCRRNGAHHCMMTMHAVAGSGVQLSAKPRRCPAFPAITTQVEHGPLAFSSGALIFAEIISHPAARAQTEAHARIAFDRTRQKRGPPDRLL